MLVETFATAEDLRRTCREPYGVWLDGVAPGGWRDGSLRASAPSMVMRAKGGVVELAGRGGTTRCSANPFEVLR